MITKYYSPEADGGGIAPDAGVADTAQEPTAPEAGGEGSVTVDDGGGSEPAQYDIAELEAKFANREKLTAEEMAFYDAYDKEQLEGAKPEPEQEGEQAKQEEPQKAEVPEWQANTLKAVGAKTPEEVPDKIKGLLSELSKKGAAISGYNRLMNECKSGNQVALAEFQRIYGFNPIVSSTPAAPATQPRAGVFSKDMFMNEEEGELFLNEYNSLKSKLADYDKRFENFEKIRATMEQREMEADKRRIQSGLTDEICDLAELCKEDFGLSNVPIRSAIEQLLTTGSLGEKEVLKPFADYLTLYAGREPKYDNLSIKEYYKLLNFDKVKGKIAQARIDAGKAATSKALAVKPTVGVAGVGQKIAAPNLSDKELEAYYNGTKDIPDEWLEDGMPNNKMPAKLKSILLGQAA